jgi:hypothetical protein
MSSNPEGSESSVGEAPSASPVSAQPSAADAAPPIAEQSGPSIAAVVPAAPSAQTTPVAPAAPSAQTTPVAPGAPSAQATTVSTAPTSENNLSAEDDEEKKRKSQQSKPFNLEEFLNSKMGKAVVFAAAFMLTGNPLIGVAVAFATPVAYNAVKSSGFIKSTPQEPSSGIRSNSASNAKGASPAISPDVQAVGTPTPATSVSAPAPAAPAPAPAAPAPIVSRQPEAEVTTTSRVIEGLDLARGDESKAPTSAVSSRVAYLDLAGTRGVSPLAKEAVDRLRAREFGRRSAASAAAPAAASRATEVGQASTPGMR